MTAQASSSPYSPWGEVPPLSSKAIVLDVVPDYLEVKYGTGGLKLFVDPPLYYRWKFSSKTGAGVYTSNWIAMNVERLIFNDFPQRSSQWSDDVEILAEPGVQYTLVSGLSRLQSDP